MTNNELLTEILVQLKEQTAILKRAFPEPRKLSELELLVYKFRLENRLKIEPPKVNYIIPKFDEAEP